MERGNTVLDAVIEDQDDVAVAAITIAELRVGVESATGRRKRAREVFLEELIASVPIVVYDVAVARAHTQFLFATRAAGSPRGAHDLIIAATARATRRAVVTADQTGFAVCREWLFGRSGASPDVPFGAGARGGAVVVRSGYSVSRRTCPTGF